MLGRLQFWLQDHEGNVAITLGNALSTARYYAWAVFHPGHDDIDENEGWR